MLNYEFQGEFRIYEHARMEHYYTVPNHGLAHLYWRTNITLKRGRIYIDDIYNNYLIGYFTS